MEYYVIEFGQPPTEGHDTYVCVPQAWVVGHDNNKIVFRYPNEKLSTTWNRIVKGEHVSEEWPIYLETLHYRSESLERANEFIKTIEKSDGKTCVTQNSPGNSEDSKIKLSNRDIQNPNRKRDSSGRSKVNQDVNDSTTADVVLNSNELYTLCASLQALVEEMKHQTHCIDKLNSEFTEVRNVSMNNAATLKEMQSKTSTIEAGCESNDIEEGNSSEAQNKTTKPKRGPIRRGRWVKLCGENSSEAQNKTTKLKRKTIRAEREPKPELESEPSSESELSSDSEPSTEPSSESESESDADQQNQGNGTVHLLTPLNKPTLDPSSLPPEYDENDTRWTLKYRALAPGLEELKKGSGVYVDSKRLASCKEKVMTKYKFAELLLQEVFSMNALRVCSYTRKKHYTPDGRPIRVGLDKRVRHVLAKFLVAYYRPANNLSSRKSKVFTFSRSWYKMVLREAFNIIKKKLRRKFRLMQKSNVG